MALSAHLCSSLSFPFSAKPSPSPPFSSLTLPRKKINAFSSSLTTTTVSDAEIEGEILSGEWPGNISILNFEDLCKYYEPVIFKEDVSIENKQNCKSRPVLLFVCGDLDFIPKQTKNVRAYSCTEIVFVLHI